MRTISRPTLKLIWSTPDPRRVIAIAARMTYSSMDVSKLADNLGEEEITNSVKAILERHHFSVLRHVVFMFSIEGVSRAFSHQLVRHTVGHAYEQRSQHYRRERDPSFIMPDSVAQHSDPWEAVVYETAMNGAQASYEALIEDGVPKEDARQVLPNAVETQLVWTANLDALVNFIQARACRVNVPEAMMVATAARRLIVPLIPEVEPFLGPTCYTRGMCYEGDKYYKVCRKPWRSPTVLWRPSFPAEIELVRVGEGVERQVIEPDAIRREGGDDEAD